MNYGLLETFNDVDELIEENKRLIEIAYDYSKYIEKEYGNVVNIKALLKIIKENHLQIEGLFDVKSTELFHEILK